MATVTTDPHNPLFDWLTPQPQEKMLVYDRNGVCLGRVKDIVRDEDGLPCQILVATVTMFAKRERKLDCAHCRIHAGAVHTSYCLAQLDAALAN
jgi:hypothetical protein